MQDKQTEAFNNHGAFFAFSNKQYDEKAVKGVTYASLGAGLIAPKDKAKQLIADLDSISHAAMQEDLSDNGIKAIIHRELANHECQITMDYEDVVSKLAPYSISREIIAAEWPEFWNICVENDYF